MNATTRQELITDRALIWLDQGISVLPALPRSKEVRIPWGIYQTIPPSQDQVKKWLARPGANLAVVCGTGGLVVFDFDDRRHYDEWFYQAGELAHTYTEYTARGAHAFYLVEDLPVKTCAYQEAEILGRGHLCLVFPSIHPSGTVYIPANNPPYKVKSVRALEFEHLCSLLSRRVGDESAGVFEDPKPYIPPTDRNDLIAKIKIDFPILDFVRSWTDPRPSGGSGRYYVCHCLWHEDQRPSMWIDTVRGLWGCFSSSCPVRQGGDVINLYALYYGLSVQEAIKRLAGGLK